MVPGEILDQLLHERPDLNKVFQQVIGRAQRAFPGETLAAWRSTCDGLITANLSQACLLTYFRSGAACAELLGAEATLRLGEAAAKVGRMAGNSAALALLSSAPRAARALRTGSAFWSWLVVIEELSELAPESIEHVMSRVEGILGDLDVEGFRAWALSGIRSSAGDPEQRIRYFSFSDIRAEQWLQRESGKVELSQVERRLKAYLIALWNLRCLIRRPVRTEEGGTPRRVSFDGPYLRVPEAFKGFAGRHATELFRAAVAHVAAHLVFTGERFPVGTLKPLQVALVSIIEDARVENLAIRSFPGLRDLWLPFHEAVPERAITAPALLARLSRALLDPDYQDGNAWVQKGRRLFFERQANWSDQAISREIGGLLGNDLGQLRIQFNVRTYVVEPPYRDDNMGIWDFGDQAPDQTLDMETVYESVRIERKPEDDTSPAPTATKVEVPEDDAGIPVAHYPEWDYLIGRERPDWTTIMDFPVRKGSLNVVKRALEEHPLVVNRITALIRSARISRPMRQRRQPEGDRLDLDACIEAAVSRRRRETPDPRVYMTLARRNRDLAVLLLLDISESTKDRIKGGYQSVLSLERDATILLAHALTELDDPFAIRAFCSNGREEIRYLRIKDFTEAYQEVSQRRLAGLTGGFSTRIGSALRHAGVELSRRLNNRKLLLVITDGEPSDIDIGDRKYLVEDARQAVSWLGHLGVDVFCVGLDSGGDSYLHRIFGHTNVLVIDRLERLPEKLTALYFKLTK